MTPNNSSLLDIGTIAEQQEFVRQNATVNTLADKVSYGVHKSLAIGLAAATIFLGSPLLTGIGLAGSLLAFGFIEKVNRSMRERLPRTSRDELPQESKVLPRKILAMSKKLGLTAMPELHALGNNGSRSSSENEGGRLQKVFSKYANAAAVGTATHDIIVSGPLLEALTPDEEETVVGHEVGHLASDHLEKQILLTRIVKAATTVCLVNLAVTTGTPEGITYCGAMATWLLMKTSGKLMLASYSRRAEFEADRIAAEVTKKPLALASALQKISNFNYKVDHDSVPAACNKKSPLLRTLKAAVSVFQSHPNLQRRCCRLYRQSLGYSGINP